MVNVAKLRGAFLKRQLSLAIVDRDPLRRQAMMREIRRYLEWWGQSLTARDQRAIAKRLPKLLTGC